MDRQRGTTVTYRLGHPVSGDAILVRSKRRFLPELSRSLERRSIPHDSPDTRLVDHPAARIVFDLALAASGNKAEVGTGAGADVDRAMRRILLGPLFGLSLSEQRSLERQRTSSGAPWAEVIKGAWPTEASLASVLENAEWTTEVAASEGFWHVWTALDQFNSLATDRSQPEMRSALTSLSQALASRRSAIHPSRLRHTQPGRSRRFRGNSPVEL